VSVVQGLFHLADGLRDGLLAARGHRTKR
jgi:hypothetical protein